MMGELYGKQMSDAQIAAYVQLLSGYDVDLVVAGIGAACKSCRFMPTVADILAAAGVGGDDLRKAHARQQAYLVIDALSGVGVYGHPVFDDPVTASIVRRMGWRRLCATLRDDAVPFFVRDFVAHYISETAASHATMIGHSGSERKLLDMASSIGVGGSSLASK